MLTGQAKRDYQREYRSKQKSVRSKQVKPQVFRPVEPEQPESVRPNNIGAAQWAYMQYKDSQEAERSPQAAQASAEPTNSP